MSALSIHLPDQLAKASASAAKELGMSRTQFIRQALVHELAEYRLRKRQDEIGKALSVMGASKEYQTETSEMDQLSDDLPEEDDFWWEKE